jgi:hypothetical protein
MFPGGNRAGPLSLLGPAYPGLKILLFEEEQMKDSHAAVSHAAVGRAIKEAGYEK